MPYDSEIIAFIRRIDKNDDGVITHFEIRDFLQKFKLPQSNSNQMQNSSRSRYRASGSERTPLRETKAANNRRGSAKPWELDRLAKNRKIAMDSTVRMLSPERNERIVYQGEVVTNENIETKKSYLIPKDRFEEISKAKVQPRMNYSSSHLRKNNLRNLDHSPNSRPEKREISQQYSSN